MLNQSVLDNGIKILTKEIPHLPSVSTGVWVKRGARDEDQKESGVSHFIEHMLFKGTEKRSALDISREIDSVGGILNAFTGRESTCFYTKVLGKDLPLAVDILSDIYINPVFDPQEMEKERSVILQEIKMVDDTPDDLIHDLFAKNLWGDHALGYPILGDMSSVSGLERDQVRDYFDRYYFHPESIIISAAGNLKHDELVRLVEKSFGNLSLKPLQKSSASSPTPLAQVRIEKKDLEQVHLCLGTSALPITHPKRYHLYLLNTVLGGGMSSRLFQEIREKRGLAYSVYSYLNSYNDTGSLVIYAGMDSKTTGEVISLVLDELEKLKNKSLDGPELSTAKEQLKGNMLLGLESTDSWMSKIARDEIYFERFLPVEEIMAGIDDVTSDDVINIAGKLFSPDALTLVALGKVEEKDLPERLTIED